MPIVPPSLDDRSFDDLVQEVLARIPAHAPEYAHPRVGDPGRTLIDLFAWLTDAMLYRVNLIPERQRLAFLSLLGVPLRPANPATGVVSVHWSQPSAVATTLVKGAIITGAETFETTEEVSLLPVEARCYYKRALDRASDPALADLIDELEDLYDLTPGEGAPYAATTVFADGAETFDMVGQAADRSLWVALLAGAPELVADARLTLQTAGRRLHVGIAPAVEVEDTLDAAFLETIGASKANSVVWEVTTGAEDDDGAELVQLDVVGDSSSGIARRGVVTLALPGVGRVGAPVNDVRIDERAGMGKRPPRIDDPEDAERLVAWIRLRPASRLDSLPLQWLGTNAVQVQQLRTLAGRVVGISDGTADQAFQLPGTSVQPDLDLQVQEDGLGYRTWTRVDALELAGRDDGAYTLDAEAGIVRFGDGVRGKVPTVGARVRVASMRYGGGAAGNLPTGSLESITANDPTGQRVNGLAVTQVLPTVGGTDAETVSEAEKRIPQLLTHRDRAVTGDDYRTLARTTPGVAVRRVEVLPRFKPHTRDTDVPGVVSVMVLPDREDQLPPNPRPDRLLIETVHAWLDPRRPIGTELYVIGCAYKPVGISMSVEIRPGFGRDETLQAVRDAVRAYLWPLPPGGPFEAAEGWPLGRPVRDRELEVVIARVPGVDEVRGVNLFGLDSEGQWGLVPRITPGAAVEITLDPWELPEILSLSATTDATAPTTLAAPADAFADDADNGGALVGIPVVPEVC